MSYVPKLQVVSGMSFVPTLQVDFQTDGFLVMVSFLDFELCHEGSAGKVGQHETVLFPHLDVCVSAGFAG